MASVKWVEIKAECGDYRAGFVATFKKYEGQATDEKDKRGRAVIVTAASFARHMGIPRQTFEEWIAKDQGAAGRHRGGNRDERGAKTVLRDPEQRAKVIESLDEDERLEIAKVAMAPRMRDEERSHKEREAHRESKPARERGVIELISSLLDGADLNLLEATRKANDTAWDDPEVNAMAEGRIDRTAMRLDLLRMAVRSEGDIEAELAKIEEMS
jgi:hypothetical protein